jgi:hypothetical protein
MLLLLLLMMILTMAMVTIPRAAGSAIQEAAEGGRR